MRRPCIHQPEAPALPVCQGRWPWSRASAAMPLVPGQVPPGSSVTAGTAVTLFSVPFPARCVANHVPVPGGAVWFWQRRREAGSGAHQSRAEWPPLPGRFLFAALPHITNKSRNRRRRQCVLLFCDSCKESARLLLSTGSFLIASDRRVAPHACAEAALGVRAPAVSCGGRDACRLARVEALCRFSVRA